jgi:hypothetical protein
VPVIDCYEYLSERLWRPINSRKTQGEVITRKRLTTLAAKIGQDDLLLRWAVLIHDLTKERGLSEIDHGPHGCTGSQVAGLFDFLDSEAGVSVTDVKWLLRHHDLLGNLYTGEQRAQELWSALGGASWSVLKRARAHRKLGLLQVMMFCDLWGTADGNYLTNEKVDFWLDIARHIGKFRDFVSYRVFVWTCNDYRKRNLALERRVNKGLLPKTRSFFSKRIARITQGFYLFVELVDRKPDGPELLSMLMNQITDFCLASLAREHVVNLQFERYRADGKCEELMERYMKGIRTKLVFKWEPQRQTLVIS